MDVCLVNGSAIHDSALIILPVAAQPGKVETRQKQTNLFGALQDYASPEKQKLEKLAWQDSVHDQ
jgi:hypothetical protein